MKHLIPISQSTISGSSVQTVNARDLHVFLGARKDFSNWIKDRIEQFDFKENGDFVVYADFGENPKGGRPSKEYALTLDMAKELSMVERNAKGKEARQYFIECERRAMTVRPPAPTPANPLADPAWLRNALATYTDKVIVLEATVEKQRGNRPRPSMSSPPIRCRAPRRGEAGLLEICSEIPIRCAHPNDDSFPTAHS